MESETAWYLAATTPLDLEITFVEGSIPATEEDATADGTPQIS